MMFNIQHLKYRLALLAVLTLSASAQETLPTQTTATNTDSVLLRNYDYVRQQDAWMQTDNAAALTRFQTANIATAHIAGGYEGGSWHGYSEAKNVVELNAGVEALHRLSSRTVVYGAMNYDNFSGSDMTGSVFIDPSRKPFDICEYSADNAGDKHRDTYHLTGAVGTDVWRGYAVGARIDYTSANYAKYKDLRHQNKLMDLRVSAGAYAPLTAWLHVGAHYAYHRNTESVSFSVNGKNEVVYKSLINYGAYFGAVEQFGNDGYTDQAREMPLFEDGHGFGVQAAGYPCSSLALLATYSYADGSGYYGRKSPYTVTYTQHDRRQHLSTLALVYQGATDRHRLDVGYAIEKLSGRAETVRGQKNEAGATYYEYYDPVEMADKQWRDVSVGYTADLQVRGETPTWQLSAGYVWHQGKQAAYLYPFYRHQLIHVSRVSGGVSRHLFLNKGILTFSVGVAHQQGHGYPCSDYTFITPDEQQEDPATMTAALQHDYAFLTARQWHFNGGVQYAFIFPGTRLKSHAALAVEHRTARATDAFDGGHRTRATLTVGCTF